jgi:hypothetical protein
MITLQHPYWDVKRWNTGTHGVPASPSADSGLSSATGASYACDPGRRLGFGLLSLKIGRNAKSCRGIRWLKAVAESHQR